MRPQRRRRMRRRPRRGAGGQRPPPRRAAPRRRRPPGTRSGRRGLRLGKEGREPGQDRPGELRGEPDHQRLEGRLGVVRSAVPTSVCASSPTQLPGTPRQRPRPRRQAVGSRAREHRRADDGEEAKIEALQGGCLWSALESAVRGRGREEVGEVTAGGVGHLKVQQRDRPAGEPEEDPEHKHQGLGVEDAVELQAGEREEADHRTELESGAHGVRTLLLARDPLAVRQAVTVGIDRDASIGSARWGPDPCGESRGDRLVASVGKATAQASTARQPGFVHRRIGLRTAGSTTPGRKRPGSSHAAEGPPGAPFPPIPGRLDSPRHEPRAARYDSLKPRIMERRVGAAASPICSSPASPALASPRRSRARNHPGGAIDYLHGPRIPPRPAATPHPRKPAGLRPSPRPSTTTLETNGEPTVERTLVLLKPDAVSAASSAPSSPLSPRASSSSASRCGPSTAPCWSSTTRSRSAPSTATSSTSCPRVRSSPSASRARTPSPWSGRWSARPTRARPPRAPSAVTSG